jgi:hexosaminidase
VVIAGLVAWFGLRTGDKPEPAAGGFPNVIVPTPVSAVAGSGAGYPIDATTTIASDVPDIGGYLAAQLQPLVGVTLPVRASGSIQLRIGGAPASVGKSGYQLVADSKGVIIRAAAPAGLFAGIQTLLQLVPVRGTHAVPTGTITDYPRYAYRGAMLDVARHFFTVDQVKKYIDEIAMYKLNYLHLHLTDDQGWRIAIKKWPNLTTHGGSTQVDGTPAGFYTQADYSAIVAYAASLFITVIPEIDMPGHTNAALASYPELNCNGTAPALYTGITVGFSSLCVHKELTYKFVDDVIGEIAALTPGPYIHVGGDESQATLPADYATFVERAQKIVLAHGKIPYGWHDLSNAKLDPATVTEFWGTSPNQTMIGKAVAAGTKVVLAPANVAYLDMKYDDSTVLGQTWAGEIELNTAYGWDPASFIPGGNPANVLGVEACLWTETIRTSADIEQMVFPRLPAIAELGWSPASTHNVKAFDQRVAAQSQRWKLLDINYYRSPQVSWPEWS